MNNPVSGESSARGQGPHIAVDPAAVAIRRPETFGNAWNWARQGTAEQGAARQERGKEYGMAWRGEAGHGAARNMAGPGAAWRGTAWQGKELGLA